MSGFLLDTNCVSELVRLRPDRRVIDWIEGVDEERLYLSVLTVGEIRKGASALSHGKRRISLETWLESDLRSRFIGRIVPVDEEVADRWGWITAEAKRAGRTLPVIDGLLAATALCHNLTIVSRNVGDFNGTKARVFNPWEA